MKRTVAVLIVVGALQGCASSHFAPQTIQAERLRFKHELIESTIEGALAQPLTQEAERQWRGAFWGMCLARYASENTTNAIRRAFGEFSKHSGEFQRALLEVIYTLYPTEFVSETENIVMSSRNEELFAMAALHLLRATNWNEVPRVMEQMHRTFPAYASHPILRMLSYEVEEKITGEPRSRPPLEELLSAPIEEGKPVIFSMQRKNRKHSGLAIVRDGNGKFVKMNDSNFFSIPQLALASSNLPGYVSNGNTPQGIFSVQGFGRSKNVFIGPTENVQMMMPFEAKPIEFFHSLNTSDTIWTKERYENLLPPSWKNYRPIYTAYYAGQAGRWDIIAHGTTIDPEFCKGEPYFPNAPTLGCLSAVESWSPENGERVSSEQQKLIDVMKQIGFEEGFLVVVELSDQEREVVMSDVVGLLQSL